MLYETRLAMQRFGIRWPRVILDVIKRNSDLPNYESEGGSTIGTLDALSASIIESGILIETPQNSQSIKMNPALRRTGSMTLAQRGQVHGTASVEVILVVPALLTSQ